MVTQYDAKGKIYTQVITKKPIKVIIQTTGHQLHGNIYVRPGERVMDEVNGSTQFIAVTDVEVFDSQQTVIFRSEFLTVNKDQIVWIIPGGEVQTD